MPPPGYGGIEAVVGLPAPERVRRGNEVTLFAAPGSRSPARVRTLLDRPHPEAIERSLYEADHVARAFRVIDARRRLPYDVHHCGFTAFATADARPHRWCRRRTSRSRTTALLDQRGPLTVTTAPTPR